MPNHCENEIILDGPEDDVARLLAHVGADRTPPEFNFSTVVPYPERFHQMDEEMRSLRGGRALGEDRESDAFKAYVAKWGTTADGFNSGGYEWCCEKWGTKWGAYEVVRSDYMGTRLRFQTAWSPPAESFVVALARLFPSVTISVEWFERGTARCGGFTCYSTEDADEERPAGVPCDRWGGDYYGTKGG